MIHQLIDLWLRGWRSLVEILLLWVAIYYGYLYFRGTRGAKVLTGLAIVFLTLTLISTLLNLVVIGWIIRSFSVFLAIALVSIPVCSCSCIRWMVGLRPTTSNRCTKPISRTRTTFRRNGGPTSKSCRASTVSSRRMYRTARSFAISN